MSLRAIVLVVLGAFSPLAILAADPAGLVGSWTMQDGTGAVAADSGGATQQDLALGHKDVAAAWDRADGPTAALKGSLKCTKTSAGPSADAALNLDLDESEISGFTKGFTLTVWIKPTGVAKEDYFFSLASNRREGTSGKRSNATLARIGLSSGGSRCQLAMMVRDENFDGRNALSAWLADYQDQWNFVAWVVKPNDAGTATEMWLFTGRAGAAPTAVTEQKLTTQTFDKGLFKLDPTAVALGACVGKDHSVADGFGGKMAGVRLYNKGLSLEEIQAVYAGAFQPTQK